MNYKSPGDPKVWRLLKTKSYWLALVFCFFIGCILLVIDHQSSVTMKLSSIGVNLVSAAFFGAFVALVFDRVADSYLEASLRSIFQEHLLDMLKIFARQHVPSTAYPPTDSFDPIYMWDLMDDLKNSSKFWFRGSSGKWVAPYINYCLNYCHKKSFTEIRVIILDPKDTQAISQRASDRSRIKKNSNRTLDELTAELLHEISMAIVSLYEVRGKSKIEISLSGSTASPVGIDLTEDAVYVGLQVAGPGHAARNPMSYRYAKDSLAYQNYQVELARQFEIARTKIQFDHNSTYSDLANTFKTLGINGISEDQFKILKQEAMEFQDKFIVNMENSKR